jgi:hypothetical protein
MLRARIPQFSNEVFVAIARALAHFVENPTLERILPSMFDKGVVELVSNTVRGL